MRFFFFFEKFNCVSETMNTRLFAIFHVFLLENFLVSDKVLMLVLSEELFKAIKLLSRGRKSPKNVLE